MGDAEGWPLDENKSFITPYGYQRASRCGYCKESKGGHAYYAKTMSITPMLYQKLVDRCWRRAGSMLYRPNQKGACCPHYPVRLDSSAFKPNKDQRQTLNRFNRYVSGDDYIKEATRLYPRSREEAKKRDNEFDLVERVHEAESQFLQSPPQPAHQFTVTVELDTFTDEKYEVYYSYQRSVHQESSDDLTPNGFKRFLCNSPVKRQTLTGVDGKERHLGSYHQCYRLDGRLVALGVLDLLPHCVSSVYFAYHESIHALKPGKLSALREIALALEDGYGWWYPGYYIHNCQKMRYKLDYSPQYVIDPETLDWDLLDKEALTIFDKKKYVSLSRERTRASASANPNGPHAGQQSQQSGDEGEEQAHDAEEEEEEEEEKHDCIFTSNMPGIPSVDEMAAANMDNIVLRSGYTLRPIQTLQTVGWSRESIHDKSSLKAHLAELLAAMGPDVLNEIEVDLRP